MIQEAGVLEDRGDGVEPETVLAQVEPEAYRVPHGVLDFGVAPVEVRLFLEETMIIILAGRRVQLPGRSAEGGDPVVRGTAAIPIAPDVPIALLVIAVGAGLEKPGVLVRRVVEHEIEDDADAAV